MSFFGKTMQNVRTRINVEIVQPERRFTLLKKVVTTPTFHRFKIVNLVEIHLLQGRSYA